MISMILVISILLSTATVVHARQDKSKQSLTMSQDNLIDKICEYENQEIIDEVKFRDGTKIIETSNNRENASLFTTYLPDGTIRYEYYDKINEKIYSSTAKEPIEDKSNSKNIFITKNIDIFDVADAREKSTVKVELSEEEEALIRELLRNTEGNLENFEDRLHTEGFNHLTVSDNNGGVIVEFDDTFVSSLQNSGLATKASRKKVNPTKQDVKVYQKPYSYKLQGSQSKYHSGLKKTINTRVYEFANNYIQKGVKHKYIDIMGSTTVTLVSAAVTCLTGLSTFTGILTAAGVYYSGGALRESIDFISEQYYTYDGEKSGWAYDYVTPNASGRRNGYVRTYKNVNTGKITMSWNGSSQRTNFRWVNTVHPKAYDVSSTTILNGAYNMYTSAVVTHGHWPW